MRKVKLGDYVRDKVSGFEGTIVSQHDYLNGCTRYNVQPKTDKEGKLPTFECFDEPQLEVVKEEVAKRSLNETGGPSKYEDTGRI